MLRRTLSLAAVLLFGASAFAQGITTTTITTAEVTVGAGSTAFISRNSVRKFLAVTNTGTGVCRVGYGGVVPSASLGDPLGAASAANGQGGSRTFETNAIPTGAILVFCAAASTLSVLEGQ